MILGLFNLQPKSHLGPRANAGANLVFALEQNFETTL